MQGERCSLTKTLGERKVKALQFKGAMYTAFVLGIVCLLSPFGWGWTYAPLPEVNTLLSLGLLVAATTTGVRAAQSCWRVSSFVRWPMVLLDAVLLVGAACTVIGSIMLQLTSIHNQRSRHMKAVSIALVIVAGFMLLELLSRWIRRHETPNKTLQRTRKDRAAELKR